MGRRLTSALKQLDMGNTSAVLGKLNGFIHQATEFINDGVLTAEEGNALIDAALEIIDLVSA